MECITRTTGSKPNIATYSQIETRGHMYYEHYKYEIAVEECNFGPMPWQVKLKTVHFNKLDFPKLIL